MNPAELLRLLAGFAKHTQYLAVERHLIDAARKSIGAIEHLIRAR